MQNHLFRLKRILALALSFSLIFGMTSFAQQPEQAGTYINENKDNETSETVDEEEKPDKKTESDDEIIQIPSEDEPALDGANKQEDEKEPATPSDVATDSNVLIINEDIQDEDALLSAQAAYEADFTDSNGTVHTGSFEEMWNMAASGGGTVKLYLNIQCATKEGFGQGNGFLRGQIYVPQNINITLDMNGFSLDRNLSSSTGNGRVFFIDKNAELQLRTSSTNASCITGGNTSGSGGAIYVADRGSLDINADMSISENKAEGKGGAVFLAKNSSMSIKGNRDYCRIENNTTGDLGGGIYLSSESNLKIWTKVIVKNNSRENGQDDNICQGVVFRGEEDNGYGHIETSSGDVQIGVTQEEYVGEVVGHFNASMELGEMKITSDDDRFEILSDDNNFNFILVRKEHNGEAETEWGGKTISGNFSDIYAITSLSSNKTIKLLKDVAWNRTNGDSASKISEAYNIDAGKRLIRQDGNLTIDLNGHTLDRNMPENAHEPTGNLFLTYTNAFKTLFTDSIGGGKITGGSARKGGMGLIQKGTISLDNVEVSGNEAGISGGAFHVNSNLNDAIEVSRKVIVRENNTGSEELNIYLENGSYINDEGIDTENSYIGLSDRTAGLGQNLVKSSKTTGYYSDRDGYMPVIEGGYIKLISDSGYEASWQGSSGSTFYGSLNECMEKQAASGGTVTILKGCSTGNAYTMSKGGVFDLNGKTVNYTGTGSFLTISAGTYEMKDSAGTPAQKVENVQNVEAGTLGTFSNNVLTWHETDSDGSSYTYTKHSVDFTGKGKLNATANAKSLISVTGGTVNHTGGILTGLNINGGSGVKISSGTYNLDGGAILECCKNIVNSTASRNMLSNSNGAGISTTGGTVNIKNGYIAGNRGGISGGALYASGSTKVIVNMTGGVLAANTAGQGGAIRFTATNASSKLTASGGVIAGNKGWWNGGALYLDRKADLTGTLMTNNEAVECGGAVIQYGSSSALVINGSHIIGNSSEDGGNIGGGGGIYPYMNTSTTVSGETIVLKNKVKNSAKDEENNVYLVSGNALKITGSTSKKIGITTENKATETSAVVIAKGTGYTPTEADAKAFKSDERLYAAEKSGSNIVFKPGIAEEASWQVADKLEGVKDSDEGTFDEMMKKAIKYGGTITIQKDLQTASSYVLEKGEEFPNWEDGVTIDLNGKTITSNSNDTLFNVKDLPLTIKGGLPNKGNASLSETKGAEKQGYISGDKVTYVVTDYSEGTFQSTEYTYDFTGTGKIQKTNGTGNIVRTETNGKFQLNGGILANRNDSAIYNAGQTEILGGAILNSSSQNGGGIYNTGGLTLDNGAVIAGCSAEQNGGAIYSDSIVKAGETNACLNLNSCRIVLNSSKENGGAVYHKSQEDKENLASLKNVHISGNTGKDTVSINNASVELCPGLFICHNENGENKGSVVVHAAAQTSSIENKASICMNKGGGIKSDVQLVINAPFKCRGNRNVENDMEYNVILENISPNGPALFTILEDNGDKYNTPEYKECIGVTPINWEPLSEESVNEYIVIEQTTSKAWEELVRYDGTGAKTTYKDTNQTWLVKQEPDVLVQYFATVRTIADAGNESRKVDLINTEGGKLPWRGMLNKDADYKYLYLDESGNVLFHEYLAAMYKERTFTPEEMTTVKYVDYFGYDGAKAYNPSEIWVANRADVDPEDTNRDNFTIYPYDENTKFVTKTAGENEIQVQNGSIVRMVYTPKQIYVDSDVMFFDYDVSDGNIYASEADAKAGTNPLNTSETKERERKGLTTYIKTESNGINSVQNLRDQQGAHLAFGNSNIGTGLGNEKAGGYKINSANRKDGLAANDPNNYIKLTAFGIASHMEDGKIKYNYDIITPYIFYGGDSIGKTNYWDEYDIRWNVYGGQRIMSSIVGAGTAAQNLEKFHHPTCGNTTYTNIWTNDFWPLDEAPSAGADGHDPMFGAEKQKIRFVGKSPTGEYATGAVPVSDDGQYHNSYMGMSFSIKFQIDENYVGPLEYYFFGDDDMWVFLDGKLVCDIGGVHLAVGQYVNLWDYITADRKEHELSFFWTERGASGSTCWMGYYLPGTVSIVTNEERFGEVSFDKVDTNGNPVEGAEFWLYEDEACKQPIKKAVSAADGTTTFDHVVFGTYYMKETNAPNGYLEDKNLYKVVISNTGSSLKNLDGEEISQIVNKKGLVLPQTGGMPMAAGISGIGAIAVIAFLVWMKRKQIMDDSEE